MARSRLDLTPGSEELPEQLTLEEVQARCERKEDTVRRQYPPDGELPPRHEARLASMDADTMAGAVKRWLYLTHLSWQIWDRELAGGRHSREEVEEAARQLLTREPIPVELGFRTVRITGRSYAAMVEMARHEARIDDLADDIQQAQELLAELRDDHRSSEGRSNALRNRIQRLSRVHRLCLKEQLLHRKAILAHATTEDGAPASSLEDAPDWWHRIGPAQEAMILAALFEAGPGRLQRLGPAPKRDGGGTKEEDWGYKSLLAAFEREVGVEPAEYFRRDLGQVITWVRAGAPPRHD